MLKRLAVSISIIVILVVASQEIGGYLEENKRPPQIKVVDTYGTDRYVYQKPVEAALKQISEKLKYNEDGIPDLTKLTPPERYVLLISELRIAVESGGFAQYFGNAFGAYAQETLFALNEIQASAVADLLKNALQIFPKGHPDADRLKRIEYLDKLNLEQENILEQQNWSFAAASKNLTELLFLYIEDNKRSFQAPQQDAKN